MNSGDHLAFRIEAFDCSVGVECNSPDVGHALDRYVFPSLPHTRPASLTPDILLSIFRGPQDYRVHVNQKLAATVATINDVVLAAIKALDDTIVHRMRTLRAVHAGAVLIEGRALLIPGSTHAGKSSLVAELLRRGASHFSDEYALVDNLGLIHPYPRPLLLRNGGPLQSMVLPEELNASFAACPAPVGWILALDYVPDCKWDIRELSQGEAVMLLLRNTPHELAQSPEMIDFFIRVVADASSYEGTRGDAVGAADQILELIRRK